MSLNTQKKLTDLTSAVIRFAGDSGDGIQLTGTQFSSESALIGNDISTLPNFPAEIRAPAGTLAGVSEFQIQIGSAEVFTPGDYPDALVVMNPAALKQNLPDLKKGGIIIANEDAFNDKNLQKVGYSETPLNDKLKSEYKVFNVPITTLTKNALVDSGLSSKEIDRCKNFFTLGLVLWIYGRDSESTLSWINQKFKAKPEIAQANITALKAGLTYGEVTEIFTEHFVVKPAKLSPGKYRNLNGTSAVSLGLISAAQKSGLKLFFGAYPITPASELLHELSKQKAYGVTTFQAEDEIAAVCSAIGASYAGAIGVTSSSGPGIALKAEAIGLAVIAELPLVIVNNQRGGPSTGLPTKTEQADLLQAFFGRPSESPICILAASNSSTAFELAYEACRIATKYMTPVFLLTDGYINNCSEPWLIPNPEKLKEFEINFTKENNNPDGTFLPYLRNEKTLGRAWAIPGTPELMHRIGGLEKENLTGNVSYDGDNHHLMCEIRAKKIEAITQDIPATVIDGADSGDLLVIGWGSTEGSITEATKLAQAEGKSVSRVHLYHLNPLPSDLEGIMKKFKKILIPEINSGQLRMILRSKFLIDIQGLNILKGLPLKVVDIKNEIDKLLK
jgi:2-oxoglutarate/2-oxoacid ferredoxin oxidoreductase subunit alpha